MIKIKSKKIILKDGLFDGYIYIDKDKIIEVSKDDKNVDVFYDASDLFVSPGFIDIHTHGGGGHPFINTTIDDVIKAADFHLYHGTTSILPTITAGKIDAMEEALKRIEEAIETKKSKSNILGAHFEGPYLSKKQSGAQCLDYIVEPKKEDYERIVNEHKKYLKRWTYAPEKDKNMEFTSLLNSNGIIPSIGHSDATYEDCINALNHGANLITHLYSCTSTITKDHGFRRLGIVESAFLLDEMYTEIIADSKHLPVELIKMIYKIKGREKIAVVTDSLEIAGTDIKTGLMSGTEFIVEDGVCKMLDRSAFAGSIATLDVCIKVLYELCNISIVDSVYMASKVPATLLKVNKGEIGVGYDADIVVFDKDINIKDIFVMGNKIK